MFGNYLKTTIRSHCLVCHEQMVTKFRLPDKYKLVDTFIGGSIGDCDCFGNGKFSGSTGGESEPGKEFDNGVKLL